jgi:hypothetical protein
MNKGHVDEKLMELPWTGDTQEDSEILLHVRDCPSCRRLYDSLKLTLSSLDRENPYGLPESVNEDHIFTRVKSAVIRRRGIFRTAVAVAASFLVVLASAAVLLFSHYRGNGLMSLENNVAMQYEIVNDLEFYSNLDMLENMNVLLSSDDDLDSEEDPDNET